MDENDKFVSTFFDLKIKKRGESNIKCIEKFQIVSDISLTDLVDVSHEDISPLLI